MRPSTRTLARSTLFVMGATFASSLLGFAREVTSARFFGTSPSMDAYLAAVVVPTILFGVFNGALVSALVPAFSELVARGEDESAWRLGSTIFNVLAIALSVCAALGFVFAPAIVPLVAHGFAPPEIAQTVRMTRWLIPTIVATSLAGVASAMLNARHRFSPSAVGGIAINVVTIVTVYALDRRLGIYALVLGTALGLVAQLLVQLPAIVALRMYRFTIDVRHPGFATIFAMLGPIVVGSAAGQLATFFDRNFASTLSPGYIAGMNYATKLVGFPQQIFAAAVATVIFPVLASQFASDDTGAIRRSLATGLRLVMLLTVPSVVGLIVLAHPIVEVLFQRGAFRASATDLCAGLLPYAAIGLVGTAASVVLTRCSFACKETVATVYISVGTVVLNVVLSLAWLPTLGARGLLLANSLSQWMQAALLLVLVRRLAGRIEGASLARSAARILATSLAMGLAIAATAYALRATSAIGMRFVELAIEFAVGAIAFWLVARLLGVEEIGMAARMILRKFEQRVPSPGEIAEAPVA